MAALRHVSSVLGTNLPSQVWADWRNWSRGKQVDLDRQSDVLTAYTRLPIRWPRQSIPIEAVTLR